MAQHWALEAANYANDHRVRARDEANSREEGFDAKAMTITIKIDGCECDECELVRKYNPACITDRSMSRMGTWRFAILVPPIPGRGDNGEILETDGPVQRIAIDEGDYLPCAKRILVDRGWGMCAVYIDEDGPTWGLYSGHRNASEVAREVYKDYEGDPEWAGDPEPHVYTAPAKYIVCETCRGKGSHVNPSIDAGGLTQEDFDDDPDFRESYFEGAYDVTCYDCRGRNVVPVIDEEHADPKMLEYINDGSVACRDGGRASGRAQDGLLTFINQ